MPKATGAAALFGVAIDATSDLYSIGHPSLDLSTVDAPDTALTATTGAAGNLTGTFAYRTAFGRPDGSVTTPSFASTLTSTAIGTPFLDDSSIGGTFTGTGVHTWDVITDSEGTPDTYKWRKDAGAWTTGVAYTGGTPALSDGVVFQPAATTGHHVGDGWHGTTAIVSADASPVAEAVDLTDIPISADTTVDRRIIERTGDGGLTWAIALTVYDNVTTGPVSDDVAVLDTSKVLPRVNQTGGNSGIVFLEPNSIDIEPDFTLLPVTALLGTAGKPRSIPGPIKTDGSPKTDLRAGEMLPIVMSGAGTPDSYTQVTGEPTTIAVWGATTGKRAPRTLTGFVYQGGQTVDPNFLFGMACSELDFAFSGGKITEITPKFMASNYGISAFAVPVVKTGTYVGTFAALGQRYDADHATKSVFLKITDLLASNVVKFTVSVDTHASAGGGTYSTAKFNLTRNATSMKQTKAGLQYNDSIEITDQNGINLGADVGSNRQPFVILATEPFDTGDFLVNDIYEILPTAAIPGVGAAPFSGTPARFAQGPRFTDAHVSILYGGSVIEATSGTLKLKWPKKEVNALCSGARNIIDLPNEGFFGADLTIVRYLDSTTYRQVIREDARATVRISIEGERIPINPGVLSTYREAFYVDIPQVCFTSVKAPVTGQVLVVETIAGEAEQPDSPDADLYTLTLQSRQGWRIPA